MHRFYLPSPDFRQNVVTIDDPRIVFQCFKVLRMRPQSRFSIFTGEKEWLVETVDLDRRVLTANLIEEIHRETEPAIKVALYQAIPKKPALFELILQKAAEIGVAEIFPLITKRTERASLHKFERMQAILIEAAEQSRRTRIPILHHPVNFDEVIEKAENACIAYEYEEGNSLSHFLPAIRKSKKASLFIGPEGGFDQTEVDLARRHKAHLFSMGPRILRTETAAISALSLMLLR